MVYGTFDRCFSVLGSEKARNERNMKIIQASWRGSPKGKNYLRDFLARPTLNENQMEYCRSKSLMLHYNPGLSHFGPWFLRELILGTGITELRFWDSSRQGRAPKTSGHSVSGMGSQHPDRCIHVYFGPLDVATFVISAKLRLKHLVFFWKRSRACCRHRVIQMRQNFNHRNLSFFRAELTADKAIQLFPWRVACHVGDSRQIIISLCLKFPFITSLKACSSLNDVISIMFSRSI